ncbi:MAG TPA: sulfotransferase [Saprospiraceae bacterium]|nr:sulfotransferase [Saprospiraceae bacterium]
MQIFVLGMHRSGTSMVTRLINMMGVYVGEDPILVQSNKFNLKGYWERNDVISINKDLLNSNGFDWNILSGFKLENLIQNTVTRFENEAKALIKYLDKNKSWIIKDPRCSIIYPLWSKLLKDPYTIIIYRNPFEVAMSLHLRDNMDVHYGLLLWGFYYLNIFQNTNSTPRYFVDYQEFLDNPIESTNKLYTFLNNSGTPGINFPEEFEIESFVDEKLNKTKYDSNNSNLPENIRSIIDSIWTSLKEHKKPENLSLLLDETSELLYSIEKEYQSNYVNVQLFYNTGENIKFSENESIYKVVQLNTKKIEFEFDKPLQISKLRFDPANRSIVVRIIDVYIFNERGIKIILKPSLWNGMIYDDNIFVFKSSDPAIEFGTDNIKNKKVIKIVFELEYLLQDSFSKDENSYLKGEEMEDHSVQIIPKLEGSSIQNSWSQLYQTDQLNINMMHPEKKMEEFWEKLNSFLNDQQIHTLNLENKIDNLNIYLKSVEEEVKFTNSILNASHYEKYKRKKILNPKKLFIKWSREYKLIKNSGLFNEFFYLKNNHDVFLNGEDPLLHFILWGWKEGRDPSESFNVHGYLENYPDVKDGNLNPLLHYLMFGINEKRAIQFHFESVDYEEIENWNAENKDEESQSTESQNNEDTLDLEINEILLDDRVFNWEFYVNYYYDVGFLSEFIRENVEEHWVTIGIQEERIGCPDFDIKLYKNKYSDISELYADENFNIISHYIKHGIDEGRKAVPILDIHYTNKHLKGQNNKNEIMSENLQKSNTTLDLDGIDMLADQIKYSLKFNQFTISISHDNYITNVGGIQIYMQDEQIDFNHYGISYVHLSPEKYQNYHLTESYEILKLNIIVDGVNIGIYDSTDVVNSLYNLSELGFEFISIQIHQLMGWKLEVLDAMFQNIKIENKFFFIHDYFSICPQYNLLRNFTEFCQGPKINSNVCSICSFGHLRNIQFKEINKFIYSQNFKIIIPSKTVFRLWIKHYPHLQNNVKILPHITLTNSNNIFKAIERIKQRKSRIKPRIAFLGHPNLIKGWNIWRNLIDNHNLNKYYDCFHLGVKKVSPIENFYHIQVSKENRLAMVKALKELQIDIVILPSIIPETFSYTLHESIAAGCFIITHINSGNIAEMVLEYDTGFLFVNEIELIEKLITEFSTFEKQLDEFQLNKATYYKFINHSLILEESLN